MSTAELTEALAMVRRLAGKYRHTPMGFDDAVGVGNLAIAEHAPRFDGTGSIIGFLHDRVRWAMQSACRSSHGSRAVQNAEVLITPEEWPNLLVAEDDHTEAELTDALRHLSGRRRVVATMSALGYGLNEAGAYYGFSESRASQVLGQAKDDLRKMTGVAA